MRHYSFTRHAYLNGATLFVLLLFSTPPNVSSFAFSRVKTRVSSPNTFSRVKVWRNENIHSAVAVTRTPKHSELSMVRGDNNEGPGATGVSIIAGILLFVFVAGSLLPLAGTFDLKSAPIADSVVTRQDAPGKYQNVQSQQFSLSRSAIQEKLNTVPVFYVATTGADGSALMSTDIYLSYQDAREASEGISASTVKGTTLDQVMYPLVLKRGRMKMAPPPAEVQQAEAKMMGVDKSETPPYRLVPSKASVEQAKELGLELTNSDVPLFIADRLAFASTKGPQLPLFLDKEDCITSYNRLRQAKKSLPEQPNIRTSTLLETLLSMERGTRQGAGQLNFYATAGDLLRLTEMFSN